MRRVAWAEALVVAAMVLWVAAMLLDGRDQSAQCLANGGTWGGKAEGCAYGRGGEVVRRLERSATCHESGAPESRECSYAVGRLRINIVGVGSGSAAFSVDGADEEVGYSAAFFTEEGCLRVAPGARLKEQAPGRSIEAGFVSTWTGSVYDSLTRCAADGRNARRLAAPSVRSR